MAGEVPAPGGTDRQSQFEYRLELLRQFVQENGRGPFRKEARAGNALGSWFNDRRAEARKGKLAPERAKALAEVVGEDWLLTAFERQLATLREFLDEHGRVPTRQELFRGEALGQWFYSQQHAQAAGELAAEKAEALRDVAGGGWESPRQSNQAIFEHNFALLRAEIEERGTPWMPPGTVRDGVDLYPFTNRMRSAHRRSLLTPPRIEQFEELPGWVWDGEESAWQALLYRFAAGETSSGVVWWAAQQRAAGRAGELTPERRQLLEALPGWTWETEEEAAQRSEATREQDLRELIEFAAARVDWAPYEMDVIQRRLLAEVPVDLATLGADNGGRSREAARLWEVQVLGKCIHPLVRRAHLVRQGKLARVGLGEREAEAAEGPADSDSVEQEQAFIQDFFTQVGEDLAENELECLLLEKRMLCPQPTGWAELAEEAGITVATLRRRAALLAVRAQEASRIRDFLRSRDIFLEPGRTLAETWRLIQEDALTCPLTPAPAEAGAFLTELPELEDDAARVLRDIGVLWETQLYRMESAELEELLLTATPAVVANVRALHDSGRTRAEDFTHMELTPPPARPGLFLTDVIASEHPYWPALREQGCHWERQLRQLRPEQVGGLLNAEEIKSLLALCRASQDPSPRMPVLPRRAVNKLEQAGHHTALSLLVAHSRNELALPGLGALSLAQIGEWCENHRARPALVAGPLRTQELPAPGTSVPQRDSSIP